MGQNMIWRQQRVSSKQGDIPMQTEVAEPLFCHGQIRGSDHSTIGHSKPLYPDYVLRNHEVSQDCHKIFKIKDSQKLSLNPSLT